MQNVKVTTKGKKLVLEIDLGDEIGPSKSGKTVLIASSQGNQTIGMTEDGQPISIGVNVYRKP